MKLKIPDDIVVPSLNFVDGVVIYGAGKTGRLVHDWITRYGIKCRAILDRNFEGQYNGTQIYRFAGMQPGDFQRFPVLLAIHGGVLDALAELHQHGFEQVVTMAQLYLYMETVRLVELPTLTVLGNAGKQLAVRNYIKAAYDLLADENSQKNFQRQLDYRFTGNAEYLMKPDPGLMYFPDNRPFEFNRPIHFVDCGAFDGDTIRDLLPVVKFSCITAFEPDNETFKSLRRFLDNETFSFQVFTLPAGVGSCNEVLSFTTGQDGAATFSPQGSIHVPVIAMDSLFCHVQTDMIKMDIEGAEAAALQGAIATIQRNEPVLAISVYHKPEDLWELPLLIHKLNPNYKIYLRTHHDSFHDTVCYAVPEKFSKK